MDSPRCLEPKFDAQECGVTYLVPGCFSRFSAVAAPGFHREVYGVILFTRDQLGVV